MAVFLEKLRSAWRTLRKRTKRNTNHTGKSIADLQYPAEITNESDNELPQVTGSEDSNASQKKDAVVPYEKAVGESRNSTDLRSYDETEHENNPSIETICEYARDTDIDTYRSLGLTETELRTIICNIADRVYREFPLFFDFCIIADEEDYDAADELKNFLCRTFNLSGCMINDGFYRVGADIFSCFECMMSRSSKVLFYLTENFNASHFYRRLQSGAVFQSLMSCIEANREKCVPIFPNGFPSYIPLPLAGIAGLHPKSKVSLRQSINTTYTVALREMRRSLNQQNDERRRLAFQEHLKLCVNEYIQTKEHQRHLTGNTQPTLCDSNSKTSSSIASKADDGKEPDVDHSIESALAAIPMEDEARSCIMQLVSKSSPLPSSNVNITGSSSVTVGNQVTVNLTINPPMACSVDTTSNSVMDESDSESFSDTESD